MLSLRFILERLAKLPHATCGSGCASIRAFARARLSP